MIDFSTQIFLLTVFGGMAVVMVLEAIWPLRAVSGAPLWRWINNLALTTVDFAVMLGIVPWLSLLLAQWGSSGLTVFLQVQQTNAWVMFLIVLLSLQFMSYWLHRFMHAIPFLWRIHAVHHSDPEVDATTAFRHHPLEIILSALVTLPLIALLMPTPLMLLGYNVLHAIVTIIHHGNITLGQRLNWVLRFLVVTPDFHRMHHSTERRHTDSNYATVLPLFDYLFKTVTVLPTLQQKTMPLGLTYFRDKEYSRLDRMLLIPFLRNFGQSDHRKMTKSSR